MNVEHNDCKTNSKSYAIPAPGGKEKSYRWISTVNLLHCSQSGCWQTHVTAPSPHRFTFTCHTNVTDNCVTCVVRHSNPAACSFKIFRRSFLTANFSTCM